MAFLTLLHPSSRELTTTQSLFPAKSFWATLLAVLSLPGIASAQQDFLEGAGTAGSGANALTGSMEDTLSLVSIGQGPGALAHSVQILGNGRTRASNDGFIEILPVPDQGKYQYLVTAPGSSALRFEATTDNPTASTVFEQYIISGNELEYTGSSYRLTTANGTVVIFDDYSTGPRVKTVTAPSGLVRTFDYRGAQLSSVRTSTGYQIKFQDSGPARQAWAVNNRVTYCSPTAASCSLSSTWRKGSRAQNDFYDAEGRYYDLGTSGNTQTLTLPSGSEHVAVYDNDGELTSSNRFGVSTTYSSSVNDGGTASSHDDIRTVVTNYSLGGSTTASSFVKGSRLQTITDVLGLTTSYSYTPGNQVDTITYPRGDSSKFVYDARGNVVETRRSSATSDYADLVSSASFQTTCTSSNRKYCNSPIWTENAAGARTDYTYHAQSGGVASILGPAGSDGVRPKTVFSYAQKSAKLKSSTGVLINGSPVWVLTSRTDFHGTPQSVTTTYTYDANLNLSPKSATRSASGLPSQTVNFTYDNYGNRISVDGMLPGDADTTLTYYDKLRRPTGSIGVDIDGNGIIARQAVSYIRDQGGAVTETRYGSVSGTTSGHLAQMTVYETVYSEYGSNRTLQKQFVQSGNTIHSLLQHEYDARNRRICTAVRMNPATFGSGFTNACAAGPEGQFGPDRITKTEFDVASRSVSVTSGFGSASPIVQTASYYNFGPLKTLVDGEGNLSRFEYDGFNRTAKVYYPRSSGSGHDSTDYVGHYYKSNGRKNYTRRRDGRTLHYTQDNRGRTTLVNLSGTSQDTSYTYDVASRIINLSRPGTNISYSYDAFGRRLSETTDGITVSYEYDAFSRRTRMNYPGSDEFFISYNYLPGGALSSIYQGSGTVQLAAYSYDSRGRMKTLTRGTPSNVTTYAYNSVSRLETMTNDLAGTAMDQTSTYSYTPSGQLNTVASTNSVYDPTPDAFDEAFEIDGKNRIETMNGANFSYDAAGNLKTSPGRSFGYDSYNRLSSVAGSKGSATLAYDAALRLKTVGNARFSYDGSDMIQESTPSGTLKSRFVHGPGMDNVIAQFNYDDQSSGDLTFFVTDRLGSVVGETSNGVSVATNSYDTFGKPDQANTGRFQYTGQVWLEEVKLYYYKARFYDPTIRRFLNPDPIGYAAGLNVYSYVNGDPANLTDPTGLTACEQNVQPDDCEGGFPPEDEPEDEVVSTGVSQCPTGWTCYSGESLERFLGYQGIVIPNLVRFDCNGLQCIATYEPAPEDGEDSCSAHETFAATFALNSIGHPHAAKGMEIGGFFPLSSSGVPFATSIEEGTRDNVKIFNKFNEVPKDTAGFYSWHMHTRMYPKSRIFTPEDVSIANGSPYAGDDDKWAAPLNRGMVMVHAGDRTVRLLSPGSLGSLNSAARAKNITGCAR